MVKAKSFIEKFYVAFIGFLLYAPLLVLFVCSFNDSKSRTVWGGFTLHWYTDLFQNEEVLSAVRTSLLLDCHINRNTCLHRDDSDEAPFPESNGRTFEYPAVKCGYRNRCGYHAFICAFHVTWIHFNVDSTRNFRTALHYFKCHAEISAA